MSLRVGIVGLPNVGKSTLFNALLGRQQALAANYPFATIEPNVGVVPVEDDRLVEIARVVNTEKIVPATVEFVDIAGLVKGAAGGAGLGNKFLSHIREVHLICQVLRVFEDPSAGSGQAVIREGSIDPLTDYQTVEAELIIKDLETMEAQMRKVKSPMADGKFKALTERMYEHLNAGKPARELLMTEEEAETAREWFLLTAKTEIAVLNVSEEQLKGRENLEKEMTEKLNMQAVALNARLESELATLGKAEAKELLKEYGIEEAGLNRLIKMAYGKLGLISFLTGGEIEARAWTVREGTKAPQAAAVIHTDFEKKFIKARVCDFTLFVEYRGWKGAAEKGKVRLEGNEYIVNDGDVIEFVIGR